MYGLPPTTSEELTPADFLFIAFALGFQIKLDRENALANCTPQASFWLQAWGLGRTAYGAVVVPTLPKATPYSYVYSTQPWFDSPVGFYIAPTYVLETAGATDLTILPRRGLEMPKAMAPLVAPVGEPLARQGSQVAVGRSEAAE